MPELPEVETVRRGLANLLPGRTVLRATTIDSPKSFPNAPNDVEQFLYEATIVGVRRRAKVLIIDLSSEYSLVVHLKMTGQLVFRGEDRVQNLEYGIRNLEVKIAKLKCKVVIWSHNYIFSHFCNFITNTPQIVCNVFVATKEYHTSSSAEPLHPD